MTISKYGCEPEHGCIWTSCETEEENLARNREYFVAGLITIAELERRVEHILHEIPAWLASQDAA